VAAAADPPPPPLTVCLASACMHCPYHSSNSP
jgi:hypothetical protein